MASVCAAGCRLVCPGTAGRVLVGPYCLGRRGVTLQPWHVRSHPLDRRTGSDIFITLFGHYLRQPATEATLVALLESPYPLTETAQHTAQNARYSICAGPPRTLAGQAAVWTPEVGDILPTLARLLRTGASAPVGPAVEEMAVPFTGGWLGWLGYDLAWEIERLPYLKPDPLPFPVALWYEPASFAVLDHQEQRLWLAASTTADLVTLEQLLQTEPPPWPDLPPSPTAPLQLQLTQLDYEAAILQAKKHIQAGDIFQANLSLRFEATTAAHSWSLYQRLQKINPSPFACYWYTPWGSLISCSPERLVQLQDRQVQTRPIAGTRPRGQTPQADQALAQTLLTNRKEQAEHIMLVDLERNDLGRVCDWGTVEVDELLTLEYYSHVMHLVSNVVGTLKADQDAIDVIRALFPGGTITGCPKVRCMEIIEALEPVRRSLFYGSCGYLDQRGDLDLNILIRTLLVGNALVENAAAQTALPEVAADPGSVKPVWGQVGAGIVADSEPEREWFEALQKAKAQVAALGLALL
ncbi:MAG: anthranilate synthase component I [Cyanobacteria bacterium Co-bin13]|nr:anthranilate synthase component I [Cyanobacteria bacterium Co-bin13]